MSFFLSKGLLKRDLLFSQEADYAQADKYAEVAMTADRYNPSGREFILITKILVIIISFIILRHDSLQIFQKKSSTDKELSPNETRSREVAFFLF